VRILLLFLLLTLLLACPLLIVGDVIDRWFEGSQGVEWLRSYGRWAWAAGIALLCADLILPIPATGVMAALGILYGPVLGGLLAAAGSCIAGLIAYGVTRLLGKRAAQFLVGQRDLERAERFFDRAGGWAVALSRWLPLLAEVIACLAGLAGMRPGRFVVALICGALPMGLTFATIGAAGADRPVLAIVISIIAPALLWPIAQRLLKAG
jgi:uncharacterized membrane protein YdjX (TVP38/TMEM64 family)